jgi:hypothetical protein
MQRLLCTLLFIMALSSFPLSTAPAQDAVPAEILGRTQFIKVGNEGGTAFELDYNGKVYLVTARHVVSGVPERNAVIQVRHDNIWQDYHTVKTLYPPSKDVDIAVFETDEKVSHPFQIKPNGLCLCFR